MFPVASPSSPANMKNLIPLTALAALAASGLSDAQTAYSKPSGYVTQQLAVGFNLVSVTLQKPVVFTGTVAGVNGAIVTFSSAHNLSAGKMFIAEVTSGTGASANAVQEFSTYSGSAITFPSPLSGLTAGDKIAVREAATLEEVFGTTLATGNNSSSSDIVWIPSGGGQYDRYYYRTPFVGSPVWRKIGSTEVNAPNTPVIYLDGLFVEVRSVAKSITVTGEVKISPTNFAVQQGLNLVGSIYPVGSTLASSGLQSQLASGNNSSTSDIIWLPTSPGNYNRYYYLYSVFGIPRMEVDINY